MWGIILKIITLVFIYLIIKYYVEFIICNNNYGMIYLKTMNVIQSTLVIIQRLLFSLIFCYSGRQKIKVFFFL
jgi:hypothetical protein